MPGSAIFPSAVATSLQLLTAVNNTKVTLNVNAGIGDTTLTVDDVSPLPASGYATFDDNESNPETVYYTGKSGNNLTGVTRGADNTAAGTHVTGAHLEQRWNADYHNTLVTELVSVEQNLSDRFGTDSGSHIVKLIDGSAAAPALTFQSGTQTSGLYRKGTSDLGIATAGVLALEINATQQVIIPKTSNQLILGTTNTVTVSSTAPSASRTYTIIDAGTSTNFVMETGNASLSLSTSLTVTATTNQFVLGTTRTVTISATQPASASRTWTIPDISGNGTFMALEGAQTVSGAKTFSATIAMSSQKITGLAAPTTAGDALSQNNIVPASDGTVSAPSLTFSTETATGLYKIGSGDIGFAVGGVKHLEVHSTGTTNATTYNPFSILGGVNNAPFRALEQDTTGVAGTTTTILASGGDCTLCWVYGLRTDGASEQFDDLIWLPFNSSPTVVAQGIASGSPAARTYTVSTGSLRLSMASGTYSIKVKSWGMS